jgi:hypothetical protein
MYNPLSGILIDNVLLLPGVPRMLKVKRQATGLCIIINAHNRVIPCITTVIGLGKLASKMVIKGPPQTTRPVWS